MCAQTKHKGKGIGAMGLNTYTDPGLAWDPAAPVTMVYKHTADWWDQPHPVPDTMRELAAPLTLPGRVTVRYCRHDGHVAVTFFAADLDPAANHGYTRAGWHPYHDVGKPFAFTVTRGDGTHGNHGSLATCGGCRSPWALGIQEAYGNATECGECGHRDYYSIGD